MTGAWRLTLITACMIHTLETGLWLLHVCIRSCQDGIPTPWWPFSLQQAVRWWVWMWLLKVKGTRATISSAPRQICVALLSKAQLDSIIYSPKTNRRRGGWQRCLRISRHCLTVLHDWEPFQKWKFRPFPAKR